MVQPFFVGFVITNYFWGFEYGFATFEFRSRKLLWPTIVGLFIVFSFDVSHKITTRSNGF